MILGIKTLLCTSTLAALPGFGLAHGHHHDHHHHGSLRALQGNGQGGNPWKDVDFCGTRKPDAAQQASDMAVVNKWKEKNKYKDGNRALQAVLIDVWIILIHPSDGLGGRDANDIIRNDNAQAQVDVLNAAYDSHFSFNLAGVKVYEKDSWWGLGYGGSTERQMKEATREGGCEVLNMWYTKLSGGLLGWATFPSECSSNPAISGVVNLHSSAIDGTASPYDKGDTATHEVGHWLGL
jgi:hypothetical protein